MTTQTGTVKWFNESKGYGFIAQDAGGADLFAHFRDIQGTGFKTLVENQRVQFEVKQGESVGRSNLVHFVAWDGSLWAATRTGAGFYLARIADKGDADPKSHFKAAADRVTKSNVMKVPAADLLAEELSKNGS